MNLELFFALAWILAQANDWKENFHSVLLIHVSLCINYDGGEGGSAF